MLFVDELRAHLYVASFIPTCFVVQQSKNINKYHRSFFLLDVCSRNCNIWIIRFDFVVGMLKLMTKYTHVTVIANDTNFDG